MPSVSQKQHNAMMAAKHGKSTLGIPRNVGKDFVAADSKAGKYQKRQKRRKRLQDSAK